MTPQEAADWLQDNLGDKVQIITPQFDRVDKLEFEYIPDNEFEFLNIIEKAPLDILKGFGFGKWDNMNNIISENINKPKHNKVSIPVMNSEEPFIIDTGRKDAPIELLEVDEEILLFPHEWYNVIPNGFIVTGLWGESYPFEKGKTDDDKRFGCLPYGIRKPLPHPHTDIKKEGDPC